jgi:short-subunit dehydrogenase
MTSGYRDGGVVVITGASGGIGRATALAFAETGARLVLASRSEQALREVASACERNGGEAVVVPTDVRDAQAMEHLARRAVDRFGRIDVWVEAAAVMIAGPFGSEPLDEIRALVDTNVVGTVLGARMALTTFRSQGHGVLVIVSSLLGLVTNPLSPLYSMTKFAVRGLALNLRQAVTTQPDVHVSLVLPGPVDTALFQRAANHTGHQLRAIPPASAPHRVASTVVRSARRPRRQTTSGVISRLVLAGHRVTPRLTEWAVARYSAAALTRRAAQEDTSGWLFEPPPGGVLQGRWRRGELRRRLGGWAAGR